MNDLSTFRVYIEQCILKVSTIFTFKTREYGDLGFLALSDIVTGNVRNAHFYIGVGPVTMSITNTGTAVTKRQFFL